jgi:putative transposase
MTLPQGDDDFSNRIKAIEIRFVHAIPATERRSPRRVACHECAVRQRRFRDHSIRIDRSCLVVRSFLRTLYI